MLCGGEELLELGLNEVFAPSIGVEEAIFGVTHGRCLLSARRNKTRRSAVLGLKARDAAVLSAQTSEYYQFSDIESFAQQTHVILWSSSALE
jgi:hypothetical protein